MPNTRSKRKEQELKLLVACKYSAVTQPKCIRPVCTRVPVKIQLPRVRSHAAAFCQQNTHQVPESSSRSPPSYNAFVEVAEREKEEQEEENENSGIVLKTSKKED